MGTKFFDPTLVRTADQAVEFMSSILESSTEHSIIGEDLDGNILLWNEGACRLYGYQPEDVVGKANSRILHSEAAVGARSFERMLSTALRTGQWEGTVASRRQDGSELNAITVVTLRRDAAGKPVGFLHMSRDADRVRDTLRHASPFESSIVGTVDLDRAVAQFALQQAALDTAAAILITDDQGIIRWVNAAFTATTGFAAEEAIGNTPRILKSDAHPPAFYANFWSEIRSGRVWRGEFVNRKKDGSVYYDEHVVTPVRAPDGRISHYIGIIHDVTAHRVAEQKLREAHREMRDLLEHSPAVLYALSIDGDRIEPRTASANITRLLGYSMTEALSQEWWVSHLHPDDRLRAEAGVGETMIFGSSRTEYRFLHSDGSYRWIEDNRRLVHDDSGTPSEMAGVWTDVTERKEAQVASLEIERGLRDMLDNLDLISVAFDREGRVTYCNDYFLGLVGWAREEVLGADWIEIFIAPEKRDQLRELLSLEIAGDGPRHYRNEILTRSGEKRFIQWNNSVLRSAAGAVTGLATIGEDVTNRVLAEREIIENEERLRIIIDASTDAMWEWNVNDGTGRWSDRAYSMLGYDRTTFQPVHRQFRAIIHPDDIAEFDRSLVAHLEDGAPFQLRFRLRHAAGFYVPILARGQLRRERAQMVGVFTDLSELERAEAHIREQAALIDQARDAIVVRDLENRIVFWSKGAERLYGTAASQAIGRRFDELLQIDAARFAVATHTVLRDGAWNGEMEKTTEAGALIIVDCRWTLLKDEHDAPKSIFSIDTDVTEKKSLEQQFFRAQRLESLGTLAGGMAHDLNNLLMPILMGVTLLRRLEPGERGLRAIRNIETSARRGADLVKQVLLFARGLEGSRASLDVATVIGEVESILKSTFPKNISFVTHYAAAVGRVFGDATQLNQVLLNLCVNARDAMPEGGELRVSTRTADVDLHAASMHHGVAAGRYTVIEVCDTGSGMSSEVLDRVFEPFFTTKLPGKGTGFGLSTARGIVRSHGGFITVASKPGKGSRFCINLPLHTRDAVAESVASEPVEVTNGHGEVVLVVDDEVGILDVTRQALATFGYEVITAENGADAISIYEREHARIAAVVTDLMMPGMDGYALIAALRSIDLHVPIIAMSGQIDASVVATVNSAGASTFLSKPLSAGQMVRALSQVLSDAAVRSGAPVPSGNQTCVAIPSDVKTGR